MRPTPPSRACESAHSTWRRRGRRKSAQSAALRANSAARNAQLATVRRDQHRAYRNERRRLRGRPVQLGKPLNLCVQSVQHGALRRRRPQSRRRPWPPGRKPHHRPARSAAASFANSSAVSASSSSGAGARSSVLSSVTVRPIGATHSRGAKPWVVARWTSAVFVTAGSNRIRHHGGLKTAASGAGRMMIAAWSRHPIVVIAWSAVIASVLCGASNGAKRDALGDAIAGARSTAAAMSFAIVATATAFVAAAVSTICHQRVLRWPPVSTRWTVHARHTTTMLAPSWRHRCAHCRVATHSTIS